MSLELNQRAGYNTTASGPPGRAGVYPFPQRTGLLEKLHSLASATSTDLARSKYASFGFRGQISA